MATCFGFIKGINRPTCNTD